MVSCKEENSQDTQDYYCRPAYPTGLSYPIRYPQVLVLRGNACQILRFRHSNVRCMICSLYSRACLFLLHLPVKKLYLQPVEAAVIGGYRTHVGVSVIAPVDDWTLIANEQTRDGDTRLHG